jgi:hypothetical protein
VHAPREMPEDPAEVIGASLLPVVSGPVVRAAEHAACPVEGP